MTLSPPPRARLATLPRRAGDKPQETAVAVNPRDPLNAIVSYHQAIGDGSDHHPGVRVEAHVAWTTDGGETWAVADDTTHTGYDISIDAVVGFDLSSKQGLKPNGGSTLTDLPERPYNSRAWPGKSGTKRTPIRSSCDTPSLPLVSLTSRCGPSCWPERQDHDAAVGQLLDQRLRDLLGRRRHDDAVEGRVRRHAVEAVADDHLDIVCSRSRPAPCARASASVR